MLHKYGKQNKISHICNAFGMGRMLKNKKEIEVYLYVLRKEYLDEIHINEYIKQLEKELNSLNTQMCSIFLARIHENKNYTSSCTKHNILKCKHCSKINCLHR